MTSARPDIAAENGVAIVGHNKGKRKFSVLEDSAICVQDALHTHRQHWDRSFTCSVLVSHVMYHACPIIAKSSNAYEVCCNLGGLACLHGGSRLPQASWLQSLCHCKRVRHKALQTETSLNSG